MNDNQLDDLKQFIAASVFQSEERLRNEMNQGFQAVREEVHQEFQAVRQEVADGFRGVGEAIDVIHKHIDEQNKLNATVDKRLTRLEQRVA